MSDSFDPYFKWLAIPPEEQPPNHYRLLGVPPFTDDLDVIETAGDKQMVYLHGCSTGEHANLAEGLLKEFAVARLCLLNPTKKASYDAELRTYAHPLRFLSHNPCDKFNRLIP